MNNVLINRELQLEEGEWRLFQEFLANGPLEHRVRMAYGFGLLRLSGDSLNGNFRIQAGTNPGTIKLTDKSYAINDLGNVIISNAFDNLAVPTTNKYYWVGVRHKYSVLETGTCTIDDNGNVIGVGTQFTKLLRGYPNYPSVITFPESKFNQSEYQVAEVIDDNNIIVNGAYQVETNIAYAVVGTFTPGIPIPDENKRIFRYDSSEVVFFEEPLDGSTPIHTENKEFFLSRVICNDAGVVQLEDKRSQYYITRNEFYRTNVPTSDNPLIGVEEARYDQENTLRSNNLIRLGWGMSSSNYTLNPSLNLITLNGGNGGLFKTTDNFIDGMFDGWVVVLTTGTKAIVVSSVKSGTQINITIDNLIVNNFITGSIIYIVPPAEFIEVEATPANGTVSCPIIKNLYPVENGFAVISLPVFALEAQYYLNYRYKVANTFSESMRVNAADNDIIGYLTEDSFLDDGTLKPFDEQVRVQMVVERVTLKSSPNNYISFQNSVITGDKFGTTVINLDNARPIINLQVGNQTMKQIIQGTLVSTTDQFINLRIVPNKMKSGNNFTVIFQNDLTLDDNNFFITQNYSGTGDPNLNGSQVLYQLTKFDVEQAKFNNLYFHFEFDGSNWFYTKSISAKQINTPDRQVVRKPASAVKGGTMTDPLNSLNEAATITTAPGTGMRTYIVHLNFEFSAFQKNQNSQMKALIYLDGVEKAQCQFGSYPDDNDLRSFSMSAMFDASPGQDVRAALVGAPSNFSQTQGKVNVSNLVLMLDGIPN
jgi:hypothetical protein